MQVVNNFIDARYLLALSGTPDRSDKKHVLYYNYFDNFIDFNIKEKVNI